MTIDVKPQTGSETFVRVAGADEVHEAVAMVEGDP